MIFYYKLEIRVVQFISPRGHMRNWAPIRIKLIGTVSHLALWENELSTFALDKYTTMIEKLFWEIAFVSCHTQDAQGNDAQKGVEER